MAPFQVSKRGNIATLRCQANIESNYSDGQTITTIPDAYRPDGQCDFQVFKANDGTYAGTLRLYTDGRLTPVFGTLNGGVIRFAYSYIVK